VKRWIKISLIVAVLLVGTGIILFDVILEGLLKTKLESLIQRQEDRIYDYKYDQIRVKFIAGDLVLTNLTIKPRRKVLDSLKSEGILKEEIFNIELKEFRLEGLESWKLLLNNEININAIVFDSPRIEVYRNKAVNVGPSKELAADIIAPTIDMAIIGKFEMSNGSILIREIRSGDTLPVAAFDSANFSVNTLIIDSAMIKSGEILTYEKVQFSMHNIKITSMRDYRFEIDQIYNEFEKKQVHIEGLKLSPKQDKYEYMLSQKYETDWFDIRVDHLTVSNFDVPYFQKTGKIDIASLDIGGAVVELYRDKRLPDGRLSYKPLPSRMLRNFKTSLTIGEIDISNSKIQYLEWEENATQPIVVKFTEIAAEINLLSTDPENLKENDSLTLHVVSTFMGYGKMEADFLFPVNDTTDVFFVDGRISNLPLASLNPIIQHSAFVKVEEGVLNNLTFEMTADDISSHGVLDMDYSGLKKLNVMRNKGELDEKKQKGKKGKEQKKFLSFIANTVVPRAYNPDSKNYYSGKISFQRVRERAIFGYLVKSILSGVITSLVPSKQENYRELKHQKKNSRKEESKKDRRKKNEEKKSK